MKILGISCYYHDSAAALIEDGRIVAAAQEERFSRIKGDERFPALAIKYCLEQAQISIQDVDAIVFYEKPFLKFERILETFLNTAPKGIKSFLTAMPVWLQKKLNQKSMLKKEFNKNFSFLPKKIYFSQHHLSHAASTFFPSPYEKAAVLCIDGVGEWATTSAWLGEGADLKPIWEVKFPHSLGLLYATFTYYCGFKINSGEYKLMGLAPFGQPRFADLIKEELITLNEDGSFWLDTSYFGYIDDLTSTNKKFEKLFGRGPRHPEDNMDDFYKDVAASIQVVLNQAVLNLAKKIKVDTGVENLCMAGGVALNCVSNGLLAEKGIFKNIWIQPASGDAGGALGAALAIYYLHYKKQRDINPQDSMSGAYLGPTYQRQQIEKALKKNNLIFSTKSEKDLLEKCSQLLSENKILGWFQGRMEYGPRALGARSILAMATDPKMKSILNLKIKFRESFRPFAPIVKDEDYEKYFSLNLKNEYMLFTSQVKNTSLMPAITHMDFSARVQTVSRYKNERLHDLLTAFADKTGHGVLINTSFNVRGEPIVCTPEDAVACFINTDMDALAIEDFIVIKEDNPHIRRNKRWHEQFKLD
jgi:carbamoyltransferase